jgi:Amt family ammonium transporter
MLWVGWFGFNAGSALGANGVATLAFVCTHAAAAAAALTWMAIDRLRRHQMTALGAVSGAVSGLVAITPAAGYVSPLSALGIGAIAAGACYWASHLKERTGIVDDTLDSFTIHGVGGILGALLTGVFASRTVNPAGADGWLHGNPHQVAVQLLAVGATIAFTALATWLVLKAIDLVFGLRVLPTIEAEGLDVHTHRHAGYAPDAAPLALTGEP